MEKLNLSHTDATVTPAGGKTGLTLPGIVVSATLAASAVSPYGSPPQYQINLQSAKLTTKSPVESSDIDTRAFGNGKTLEAEVSSISREEIDAKLALSKSELEHSQTKNFSSIEKLLIEVKGEIGALRGEISGNKEAVSGQIDGLKSSISTMQWMVGTVIAMIGIVVAIMAIPGIDKLF